MGRRWSEQDIPDLEGKVAVVTGANAGLGEQVATMLARRGASVTLACRNGAKAEAAAGRMKARGATEDVEIELLDLASLASVRKAVDEIMAHCRRLDILVNNAGLMGIDEARTEDDFEMQIGVNHLGHFAFTAGLAPLLLATEGSRVVNVTSPGHRLGKMVVDDLMFDRRGYRRWAAYYQSKIANLLFTLELQRRCAAAGAPTSALTAQPGWAHTDLGTEGNGLLNRTLKVLTPVGAQSAYAGALPIARAATDPLAKGGEFYGPNLQVRGHPVLETPARAARNPQDAEALWRKSEELTGVRFEVG